MMTMSSNKIKMQKQMTLTFREVGIEE